MIFTDRPNYETFSISVDNALLSQTPSTKFLGILIDQNLNFKLHVNSVISKVNKIKGILWNCKDVVSLPIKKLLYNSLVGSHLSYGIIVWGGYGSVNTSRLTATQNRIIRLIFGNSSPSIFFDQKILPFNYLYEYFILMKLFSILISSTPNYFSTKICSIQTNLNYATRFNNSDRLIPPLYTKSICLKGFLYQAITSWNKLPTNVIYTESIHVFKIRLKSTCSID